MKNKWNKRLHTPSLYLCTTVTGHGGMKNAKEGVAMPHCPVMSSVSSSSSALLHSVFIPCTQYIYTFTGYNYTLGHEHCATYSIFDFHAANLIRHIRSSYGLKSPCEGIIFYISCY